MGDVSLDMSKQTRFRSLTWATTALGAIGGVTTTVMGVTNPLFIAGAAAIGLATPTIAVAAVGILATTYKTGAAFIRACKPSKIRRRKRLHRTSFIAQNTLLQIPAVAAKALAKEAKMWTALSMIVGYSSVKSLIPTLPKTSKTASNNAKSKPPAAPQSPDKPNNASAKLGPSFAANNNKKDPKPTTKSAQKRNNNTGPKAP